MAGLTGCDREASKMRRLRPTRAVGELEKKANIDNIIMIHNNSCIICNTLHDKFTVTYLVKKRRHGLLKVKVAQEP